MWSLCNTLHWKCLWVVMCVVYTTCVYIRCTSDCAKIALYSCSYCLFQSMATSEGSAGRSAVGQRVNFLHLDQWSMVSSEDLLFGFVALVSAIDCICRMKWTALVTTSSLCTTRCNVSMCNSAACAEYVGALTRFITARTIVPPSVMWKSPPFSKLDNTTVP